MENVTLKRTYKDVLFRRVFSDKKSLLELYNAVNGTNYTNEEELTIVTLEDAIYMNVKNDIAFLVGTYLNLYEHQSTVNPNMPVRCLIYIAKEYEKLLDKSSLYSSRQQQIPTPRFIVFYNGKQRQPERKVLKLSTAFQTEAEEPELELRMTMLNINYGKNEELLKQCRKLEEYSLFVDKLRKNALKYEISEAAERTVDECIRENILRDLLREQRAEVIAMSIFYYDEEKELELIKKDEYKQGLEDGIREGKMNGIAESILEILSELGEVSASVYNKIREEQNAECLKKWLKLAVRAESISAFENALEKEKD